jgi:hypothetical protein
MNRRKFFKMFGGAVAAAMLPMGALALPRFAPLTGRVDIDFGSNMSLDDFEERILEPAIQRIAQQLDTEMMRLLK